MKDTKYKVIEKLQIFILLSLFIVCMFPNTAKAAAAPSLSASTDAAGVTDGQTIDIRVNLSNNPGLSTLGMSLDYDSSVLQYSGSTWNSSFSGSDMTMASDDGGTLNLSAVCDDAYTEDGTVVTVRFDAVGNSSTVPVTLGLRDMSDNELNEISDCNVSSQIITPKADSPEEPEKSDTDRTDTVDNQADAAAISTTDSQTQKTDSSTPVKQTLSANEGSISRVSVQKTSANTENTPDENYKTGAGIGNDVFLLLAAVFGIGALAVLCRKERKYGKREEL